MSNTIFIKSIEGTDIEFNKCNLCAVSEWFDETISNMNEDDTSFIDENNPSLSEESLKAFKILCEMNHYSSSPQKKLKLSKIIKTALPAIEKWDCPGLLRLWFNDINNSCELRNFDYNIEDILKYESLISDEQKIYWEEDVLLYLTSCFSEKISELKPFTLFKIIQYKREKILLDMELINKINNAGRDIRGIRNVMKYY
tara:strand:+ start:927 stop:1523 length:597 start_codon:yes stop_codon:yes gene_type:complete